MYVLNRTDIKTSCRLYCNNETGISVKLTGDNGFLLISARHTSCHGNGTLTGDLTIRETTKSVTLDVETEGIAEDPFGNTRVGFEASTKIDRTEFGLKFNAPLNTGGVLVSEKVTIEIEGSAIKNA